MTTPILEVNRRPVQLEFELAGFAPRSASLLPVQHSLETGVSTLDPNSEGADDYRGADKD